MANFDFGNTPITSDITLKAGWCCGEPEYVVPELWDGDYLKVVFVGGVTGIATSASMANTWWRSSGAPQLIDKATGNAINVNKSTAKEIYSGKGITNFGGSSQIQTSMPYVDKIIGFWDGLTTWSGPVITFDNDETISGTIDGLIKLPSTLTGGYGRIIDGLTGMTRWIGCVQFDCPTNVFSDNLIYQSLFCKTTTCPSYIQGVKVTGEYVDQWLEKFSSDPDANHYRNLIKV